MIKQRHYTVIVKLKWTYVKELTRQTIAKAARLFLLIWLTCCDQLRSWSISTPKYFTHFCGRSGTLLIKNLMEAQLLWSLLAKTMDLHLDILILNPLVVAHWGSKARSELMWAWMSAVSALVTYIAMSSANKAIWEWHTRIFRKIVHINREQPRT